MGEETPPPSIPSAAHRNGSSSAVRFLGLLKQPDPAHHNSPPFEFDESDLIWSSSPSPPPSPSASLRRVTSLSSSPDRLRRHFFPEDLSGLSVALASDDAPSPRVSHRRKDPSASAAVAARAVAAPRAAVSESAPVNVPAWPKGSFHVEAEVEAEMDLEEEEEEEEMMMLPPHEIVARSQLTTFSVFEGVGRTLKGRDLHRVRNAVFQKTGFLD
ncbi:hypothetical protein QJS04_geneDACA010766 [Acorus gramineus]|uniref:Senescence regulator n=1 Tax=Acorus gramineus TaxID=55184 RepID=A0AAV9BCT2_ACOGR|nr:hypothetical protein QJS04_geneDACA010766 [Acorus gramineus]